ncbi:MAG: glycosyltransferase family 39 protein [bacterium]|nr:glycosyltransferase family 39 protein [bacterium]
MKKKILNLLFQYWHIAIIIIVSFCFFLGSSSYSYITQKQDFVKWSSPDEAANYNFTKLYAQAGQLSFFEKYNFVSLDVIRPRSYRSDGGSIKPVSFLGIILIYGSIAKLLGHNLIPYLTPFFAAAGIVFYYLLVKKIFGKSNALISAWLLAVFPPYIYYSAHSMFHNSLFTVLLIISLYFIVLSVEKRKYPLKLNWPGLLFSAVAGLLLGLAVITRASELIWLIPFWLILWIVNLKKFGLARLIIFIACLLFALTPAMYWNQILYHSFWRGGYNEANRSIANIADASSSLLKTASIKSNLTRIKNNIFYFGWRPLKSLKMFYYYFTAIFYWIFWPAALGLVLFLKKIKKWKKRHYAYLISYFCFSLILIFYYGSWDFHDNPDPASRTIGNSYARYWLPVYLGALPLASLFISRLTNLLRKKILIGAARALIAAIIFFISLKFVLTGSAEGLAPSAQKQLSAQQEFNQVVKLTEARAIIITQYHDKLFFPERKVIVGLFNDNNMIKQYAVLAQYLPLYYYNFTLPPADLDYLNNRRLAEFGLRIEPVEQITKNFTLYKLYENRH